jgi:hypothetical protein
LAQVLVIFHYSVVGILVDQAHCAVFHREFLEEHGLPVFEERSLDPSLLVISPFLQTGLGCLMTTILTGRQTIMELFFPWGLVCLSLIS